MRGLKQQRLGLYGVKRAAIVHYIVKRRNWAPHYLTEFMADVKKAAGPEE